MVEIHPAFVDDTIFARFLAELAKGRTPYQAADLVGFKWTTIRNRIKDMADEGWPELFAEAWEERREHIERKVDSRVEALVMSDDPAPSTVALWAKRHHPGYREKTQVELSGPDGMPIPVAQKSMVIDLAEVARILRDAGVDLDGPAELVSGSRVLPAPS